MYKYYDYVTVRTMILIVLETRLDCSGIYKLETMGKEAYKLALTNPSTSVSTRSSTPIIRSCLLHRQTCSKSRHHYIIFSKCPHPERTEARRRWRHVVNRTFNNRVIQICSLVVDSLLVWRYSSKLMLLC